MKVKLIKLYLPDSVRLHVGKGGVDEIYDYIPADTMFSALVNAYAIVYGVDGDELIEVAKANRLRISSAYPGVEVDGREVRFMPMPRVGRERSEGEEVDKKFMKRVRYCEFDIWCELVESIHVQEETGRVVARMPEGYEWHGMLVREQLPDEVQPFRQGMVRKVVVDRLAAGTNVFYEATLYVNRVKFDGKMYRPFFALYAKGDERLLRKMFDALIVTGVGGKRSVGEGKLVGYDMQEMELKFNQTEYQVGLARVYPKRNEVDRLVAYNLVVCSGYVMMVTPTGERRKNVRLLEDGFVSRGEVEGDMPVVGEYQGKEIYRYGYNFVLNKDENL